MDFFVDKNEFGELKKLFCDVFSEDEKFVDMMFENKFDVDHIFTVRENNEIVCTTYGIYFDCKVGSITGKCIYIYGVGTKPAYRGKGYVKKIFDYINQYYKEKGVLFLYLVPSSASLFHMYEKFGYQTAFFLDNTELDLSFYRNHSSVIKPIEGDFHNDYLTFIGRFDNVVIRSKLDNQLILKECDYEKINNSGFLYYIKDKTAVIRESFIDRQSDFDEFLVYLANRKLEKAVFTQYQDAKTPYAMVYPLSDRISIDDFTANSYTNMNFE